jgi:hypothetical protein
MRKRLSKFLILAVALTFPSVQPAHAIDGVALLASCVAAINDPLYTASTLPGLMGRANQAALETAITNGTITVWIANGSGLITGSNTANGNGQDLFCGDSNDNSIPSMDSSANTRDFFFGGAGNDSVTGTSWYSTFYGGLGNDYMNDLQEQSFFYGGPGNDSYGTISTGAWASTFDQGIDIVEYSSFSLAGGVQVVAYRTNIVITTVVSAASKVTFFASGKRIANCINRATTGSGSTHTATCTWKPSVIGAIKLSATAVPTGAGATGTYLYPNTVFSVSRSNLR